MHNSNSVQKRKAGGILAPRVVTLAKRERLRERCRPRRCESLFVGEAPPASGRFFYRADSGLYRAIRDTFSAAFPCMRSAQFLDFFRSLGCYLVDLCGSPVDGMNLRSRRRICLAGEARLSRRIRQLRPKIIVTVVRSIGINVRRAEQHANWSGPHFELPYPGRWHRYRGEFRRKLVPVLRANLRRSGVWRKRTRK
jgi:hypothetical protein